MKQEIDTEMYQCVACEETFHVDDMVPAYDDEGGQCGRFCEPCEEQAPRLTGTAEPERLSFEWHARKCDTWEDSFETCIQRAAREGDHEAREVFMDQVEERRDLAQKLRQAERDAELRKVVEAAVDKFEASTYYEDRGEHFGVEIGDYIDGELMDVQEAKEVTSDE